MINMCILIPARGLAEKRYVLYSDDQQLNDN